MALAAAVVAAATTVAAATAAAMAFAVLYLILWQRHHSDMPVEHPSFRIAQTVGFFIEWNNEKI